MRARRLAFAAAVAGCVTAVEPSMADEPERARAEALFREGRALFDAGQHQLACERFAESHRLDAAAGTLFNLAVCEESVGKIGPAWEHFRALVARLPPDDKRRAVAEQRAAALEARLSRITIALPPRAPDGLAVTYDGAPLAPSSFGVATVTPPGRHQLVVSVPGRPDRRVDIDLAEGQTRTVVAEPAEMASTSTGAAPAPFTPASPPVRADGTGPWRTVGWVTVGVGAAAIALGAVAGLLAIQRNEEVEETCPKSGDKYVCDADGLDAAAAGEAWATTSTLAFILGGVAVGAGATIVLVNPTPRAAGRGALLQLTGRF
jgi:hypothetical protein